MPPKNDPDARTRNATLFEVMTWCEQEADKQYARYRSTCGEERVSADAAEWAFEAVAEHCWELLGQGGGPVPPAFSHPERG